MWDVELFLSTLLTFHLGNLTPTASLQQKALVLIFLFDSITDQLPLSCDKTRKNTTRGFSLRKHIFASFPTLWQVNLCSISAAG